MLNNLVQKILNRYPTPVMINFWWNLGFIAIIILMLQLVTGILNVMHYINNPLCCYFSILYIEREVFFGIVLHLIHAVCASLFFFVIYVHVGKGLYYGGYVYPRHRIWVIGIILLLVLTVICFLGYVLPWGQISYWVVIVITNIMVTVVPLFV
jgi:quinol-cytochrome oxidoreductase complex cytochrome b subunit